MPKVKIAEMTELPDGEMLGRSVEGTPVLLARIGDEVYAMDDVCTHMGAPLHEGILGEAGECLVTCPWHEAHFDVRTGGVEQETPWATETETYAVEIRDGDIYVEI